MNNSGKFRKYIDKQSIIFEEEVKRAYEEGTTQIIQTVSNYMGHSDSTVTLKIYSHFIPDTQEKVVNALNFLTT